MIKTVLVTGDRGYIGSVLVPFLLKKNYRVKGLDASFFGKAKKSANYTPITKDIREITSEDIKGVDAIIHLSALSNDPMGELDKKLTEDINLVTSLKLAKLAKSLGVKRFIFSSSCSIYGIAKTEIVDERSKVNPLTTYAKSKYAVEVGLKSLASSDFCVGIMRNSTVYGYSPRFRDDLVVNNLVTSALALGKIRVLSDGTPWRPLIDVRDLARAFVAFLEIDANKVNGQVINVGFTDSNYRVRDIVDLAKKELPECQVEYTNEHGADTRSYRVDFSKFKKIFPKFKQEWPMGKSIHDLVMELRKINYGQKDFDAKKYTRLSVLKSLIESGKITKQLFYRK